MKPSLYVRPSQFEPLEDRIAPAVFVVNSITDDGVGDTLREAIVLANGTTAADTITFDTTVFTPGMLHTIVLNGSEIDIEGSLTIKGSGADVVAISGDNLSRIFNINDQDEFVVSTVSISGLSLIDGFAATGDLSGRGGAIYNKYEALSLTNLVIANNVADSHGGGVFSISYLGKFVSNNTQFINNTAGAYGGGLSLNTAKAAQIVSSLFSGNISQAQGGGAYVGGYSYNGTKPSILIDKSNFINNASTAGDGGGLAASIYGGSLTIKNSTVSGNYSYADGGGIHIESGDTGFPDSNKITLDKVNVSNNTAFYGGGGIAVNNSVDSTSSLSIKNSQFLQNESLYGAGGGIKILGGNVLKTNIQTALVSGNVVDIYGGGGLFVESTLLTASKLTVQGNTGEQGGGLYLSGGSASISGSSFTGNEAPDSGGGISASNSATLILKSSSVNGNVTGGAGGGIWLGGGSLMELSASTITGNHAGDSAGSTDFGGGIYVGNMALGGSITKTTISGNASDDGGGGVHADLNDPNASLLIQSSTITANTTDANGGGLNVLVSDAAAVATISSTTVSKNYAAGKGGGIYFSYSGARTVTKSNILDNVSVGSGGGIYNQDLGLLTLSGGLISGNVTEGNGGGVFNHGAATPVTVLGTKVSGNFSPSLATSNVNNPAYFPGFVPETVTSTKGTYMVTNNADSGLGSLRAAIDAANLATKPVSIGFNATAQGTIPLLTALPAITNSITFNGLGVDNLAIDASTIGGGGRIFDITGAVTINGIAFEGGDAGGGKGGAIRSTESLTLNNTVFSDNTAVKGGAVHFESYFGKLSISNSRFTGGNAATDDGGAVYAHGATSFLVTNSMFSGNAAGSSGGGVYIHDHRLYDGKAPVVISKSVFANNTATNDLGGGVFVYAQATIGSVLTITDTLVNNNTAGVGGGLFLNFNVPSTGAKIALTNLTVANNASTVDDGGGAIVTGTIGAAITMKNGKFLQNTAADDGGGAVFVGLLEVNILNSLVSGNSASMTTGIGGGFAAVNGAYLVMKSSTLSGNEANQGGGIAQIGSFLDMTSSNITGNTAVGGGGIHSGTSFLYMDKSQISGNSASSDGGGILMPGGFAFRLTGSQVLGNNSGALGGGLSINSVSNVEITKNTLAGNIATRGGGLNIVQTLSTNTIIQSSIFTGNIAFTTTGGGIHADFDGATSTISGLTLSANFATTNGGGAFLTGGAQKMISKSTFSGNVALTEGGGIYNTSGVLTLTGGSVTANYAGTIGGGVRSTSAFTNNGAKIIGNFAPTNPNIG